jgi:hypothetical protein
VEPAVRVFPAFGSPEFDRVSVMRNGGIETYVPMTGVVARGALFGLTVAAEAGPDNSGTNIAAVARIGNR